MCSTSSERYWPTPHNTTRAPLWRRIKYVCKLKWNFCSLASSMCASWHKPHCLTSPHPIPQPTPPFLGRGIKHACKLKWTSKSSKFVRVATHLTSSHRRGFRSHRQMAERDRTFQVREWCWFFRSEYYSEKKHVARGSWFLRFFWGHLFETLRLRRTQDFSRGTRKIS